MKSSIVSSGEFMWFVLTAQSRRTHRTKRVWSRTNTWRHVALPAAGRPRVSSSAVSARRLFLGPRHTKPARATAATPRATPRHERQAPEAPPRETRREHGDARRRATRTRQPARHGPDAADRHHLANSSPTRHQRQMNRENPAPPAPPRAWACERMRLREIDTATGTAADAAAGTAADTIDAVAQDTDRPTQHKLERKLQQTRTDSNARAVRQTHSSPTCPGTASAPPSAWAHVSGRGGGCDC